MGETTKNTAAGLAAAAACDIDENHRAPAHAPHPRGRLVAPACA